MAECEKVCRYVDLPLQHASADVLKRMRRPGNRQTYDKLLARIRGRVPGVTLRTDLHRRVPGRDRRRLRRARGVRPGHRLRSRRRVHLFARGRDPRLRPDRRRARAPEAQAARRADVAAEAHRGGRLSSGGSGAEIEVVIDGPSPEHELVLQGRTEGQAPDIDAVVYLTDCDPGLYQPGELIRAQIVDAREYDLVRGAACAVAAGACQADSRSPPDKESDNFLIYCSVPASRKNPSGPVPTFCISGAFTAQSERLERLRGVAARVAESYGLEIFDVQLRRESIGTVLRVIIDRPDRGVPERPEDAVGIEECQRVSQDLSALLDVEEDELGEAALGQNYTLEVSSPGLDRPLRHEPDYRRFTGRLAKVVTIEPVQRTVGVRGPDRRRRVRRGAARGRAEDAPGAARADQAGTVGGGVLDSEAVSFQPSAPGNVAGSRRDALRAGTLIAESSQWLQSIRCCSRSTRSPRKRASSRKSSSTPCRTRSRRPRASVTRARRSAPGSTPRPVSWSSTR